MPGALPITGLEIHDTGELNVNSQINGNWEKIEDIFGNTGAGTGILQNALSGLTTITYGASISVDLAASKGVNLCALTGALAVAVAGKVAGRSRRLILVGDGTARAVTWPVGAVWSGPPMLSVGIGKTVAVTITATGTTDASLVLEAAAAPAYADIGIVPKGYGGTGADNTAVTFPGTGTIATLAGTETLTNKTLTTPRIGFIFNSIGLPVWTCGNVASSVNYINFSPSVTGAAVSIEATGSDSNIDIGLYPKGTGAAILPKADIVASRLRSHSALYVEVTSSRAVTDADNGHTLWSSAAYTLTFPDSLTKPFSCNLKQEGSGAITVAVSGTAVLRNVDTHTKTGGQWTMASIDYRTGNDVVLVGRTAA